MCKCSFPKIDALAEKLGITSVCKTLDNPMGKGFCPTQRPSPGEVANEIGAGTPLSPGH